MIAFGTFENFITGRERVEAAQWRNVWPVTTGFRWRLDDIRAIVSNDRLTAIGMGVFDSTGYHEDGTPYDRPGRATIAFSRAGGRRGLGRRPHPHVVVPRRAEPIVRRPGRAVTAEGCAAVLPD